MITKDREYRHFQFSLAQREEGSEQEEMIVEGTPVVFDEPTVLYEMDGVEYKEIISKDAFKDADMSDVILNIDHEGKPAAKTRNKTLSLFVTDKEVRMWADLSKNTTGRELCEDIRNGFYDKMSFAFSIASSEYDATTHTRIITGIKKLYDVSAVSFPAYSQTSLSARSFFTAEAEKEKAEALAKRKRLELLANAIKIIS